MSKGQRPANQPRIRVGPPISSGLVIYAGAAIVAGGAALRLAGLNKDLWLDEVWALRVATDLHTARQVFTLHHEINHYLITLWLYASGPHASAAHYHSLSYVCGVAAIALAGLVGYRRSAASAIISMVVVATSYELVLYSTEARGYSAMATFGLAAFYFLQEIMERRSWWLRSAYWTCTILAILSQPVFVGFLAAAIVWTVSRSVMMRTGIARTIRSLVAVHAVPICLVALLYVMDLRFLVVGGGDASRSLLGVYGTSLAWTLGTPSSNTLVVITGAAAVVAFLAGLRRIGRVSPDRAVFFACVIAVFPVLLVADRGSVFIYPRHFLVGNVFLLLLVSELAADWWTERRRAWCVLFVAAFGIANGWHISELALEGRGQAGHAVEYMRDHSRGPVTIGADQDFRVGMEVLQYLPREAWAEGGGFVNQSAWPPNGPQWVVRQRESLEPPFTDTTIVDPAGRPYDLERVFYTAPLSGESWFVYHNRSYLR